MEKITHNSTCTRIIKPVDTFSAAHIPAPTDDHTFTPIRDIASFKNDRNFSNPFGWRRQVVQGI